MIGCCGSGNCGSYCGNFDNGCFNDCGRNNYSARCNKNNFKRREVYYENEVSCKSKNNCVNYDNERNSCGRYNNGCYNGGYNGYGGGCGYGGYGGYGGCNRIAGCGEYGGYGGYGCGRRGYRYNAPSVKLYRNLGYNEGRRSGMYYY